MNERIKELAEQAGLGIIFHLEEMGVDGETELWKFAELIVRECLHIVDDEGAGEGGCIRAMIRIQEEFGVEE